MGRLQASKWQGVWESEDAAVSVPLGVPPVAGTAGALSDTVGITQLFQLQEEDSRTA